MLQVAEATSQAEGVEDVLDAAVRVTAMLAGAESCTIWLWDEEIEAFQYGGQLWACALRSGQTIRRRSPCDS